MKLGLLALESQNAQIERLVRLVLVSRGQRESLIPRDACRTAEIDGK